MLIRFTTKITNPNPITTYKSTTLRVFEFEGQYSRDVLGSSLPIAALFECVYAWLRSDSWVNPDPGGFRGKIKPRTLRAL